KPVSLQKGRAGNSFQDRLYWECSPAHAPPRQGRVREVRVEKSLAPPGLLTRDLRLRWCSTRRVTAPCPPPPQLRLRLAKSGKKCSVVPTPAHGCPSRPLLRICAT